jgi:hypothetical protein
MRDAVGAALSRLEAARVLAPPASAMHDAVRGAAYNSSLGTALVLAPFAPAVRPALRRTINSPLVAALLLTLPPAHGTPPLLQARSTVVAAQTPAHCGAHSRHPPPLSHQRSASAHRAQHTRRWQCESRSDVGFSMSRLRWSRALGRGTYGGCVVGQDGQGLLRTLHRQVRRLLARRAASPTLMVGSNTPHSTPLHSVHSTTEGHLGVNLLF